MSYEWDGGRRDLKCSNDETVRRRPNIVERETRDKGQFAPIRRLQDLHVRRRNDTRRFHPILKCFSSEGPQSNDISWVNVAKRAEERVAMSCECDVAPFSWHRCFRKVTNRSTQKLRRIALNNDCTERQARYLNLAHHLTERQKVWFDKRSAMTEFAQFNRLIAGGVRKDVSGVADRSDTCQKEAVREVTKATQSESARAR